MGIKIEDLPIDDELAEDDLDNVVGGALQTSTMSTQYLSPVTAPALGPSLKQGWISVPMVATENATAGVRG